MYTLATLVADVAALSAQLSLRNFNENAFYVARADARVGYWKRYIHDGYWRLDQKLLVQLPDICDESLDSASASYSKCTGSLDYETLRGQIEATSKPS